VIHAEAFSGAELLHGPFALVRADFPLLLFGQHDAAMSGILALAERVKTWVLKSYWQRQLM
jgi:Glucosamine 6-phosphate synthetase, contains amidotransferase and phosphosugar isomerase domains